MLRQTVKYASIFLMIPLTIIIGVFVFNQKKYAFISICLVIFSCIPFFAAFEKKRMMSKEAVIIAVMTALCIVSRIIFAATPGIKPVTALIIISAMYFGSEAGFMIGAMTAIISNFYFGQGPWTPFQMFVWGLIGFFAGVFSEKLKKSRIILMIYGFISGIAFSLIMDTWTLLWWENSFNFNKYKDLMMTAITVTALYSISNMVFLLLFNGYFAKRIQRIKSKYGI